MATTVVHVEDATPLGNFLHLLIFIAGAAVIGVAALAILERLAGGTEPARIGTKQIAVVVGILLVLVGAEVLFHVLGGS